MNSKAHAGCNAGITSLEKVRAVSRHKIGRIRVPPANTLYLIAVWMEVGGVFSAGRSFSRAASTARRSCSKKEGSFIVGGRPSDDAAPYGTSRFRLPFGIKRFRRQFAVGLFEKNFHAAFRLFELLLAFPRKRDAFLEKFHGVVQRKLRALQTTHDFLQPRERALEVRLLRRFRFFLCGCIHKAHLRSIARPISGTGGKNRLIGRPVRSAESSRRIGGRAPLRGRKRAKSSPVPETTIANRESPAPGVGSILRHAREPTQLLCAGAALLPAPGISLVAADPDVHAKVTRRNKCFPIPQRVFGPLESLSADAWSRRASRGIALP